MITSAKNPKIKWLRSLQGRAKTRREERAFVVEGVRLAEEAVAAGWEVRLCLYTPDLNARGLALVESVEQSGAPVEQVEAHVMKAASDTETPQGILLALALETLPLPDHPNFVLVLDRVSDPGNTGTLLRTARAAGVDAVWMTAGSVDAFAPKVVRGAMGAHFRLPVQTGSEEDILAFCKLHSLNLFAAAAGAGKAYTQADLCAPLALAIGSEAEGVGDALFQAAAKLHIPMAAGSESLNAAVAGGVLMFEVARQRGLS